MAMIRRPAGAKHNMKRRAKDLVAGASTVVDISGTQPIPSTLHSRYGHCVHSPGPGPVRLVIEGKQRNLLFDGKWTILTGENAERLRFENGKGTTFTYVVEVEARQPDGTFPVKVVADKPERQGFIVKAFKLAKGMTQNPEPQLKLT